MENKLQELTDKLYKEGLSKGKEEGEAILAKANEKASKIIEAAQKKADEIIRNAGKEAEDFRKKVEGDVRMAAVQSVQATRKDIENLLVKGMVADKVDSALSSPDFIKEVILAVARNFNAEEPVALEAVLPESLKSQLEPFIQGELSKALDGKVQATFSKKIAGGFSIGPKDGSYFISMTNEAFNNLISEYLRPATCKLLFGE